VKFAIAIHVCDENGKVSIIAADQDRQAVLDAYKAFDKPGNAYLCEAVHFDRSKKFAYPPEVLEARAKRIAKEIEEKRKAHAEWEAKREEKRKADNNPQQAVKRTESEQADDKKKSETASAELAAKAAAKKNQPKK